MQMSLAEWALRSLKQPHSLPLAPDCRAPLVYHSTKSYTGSYASNSARFSTPSKLSRSAHSSMEGSKASASCGDEQWSRGEWLYMQAALPAGSPLLRDMHLSSEPFSLMHSSLESSMLASAGKKTSGKRVIPDADALRMSQMPKLWLSPQGAVSPLHYDRSASMLVQIMGKKRMLFFSPSDLQALQPFPLDHMLARRCRATVCDNSNFHSTSETGSTTGIDVSSGKCSIDRSLELSSSCDPGSAEECEAAKDSVYQMGLIKGGHVSEYEGDSIRQRHVNAQEVVLEVGDVVFFGPYWAHCTASESVSASVTVRVAA
jgi:hypothetical protein